LLHTIFCLPAATVPLLLQVRQGLFPGRRGFLPPEEMQVGFAAGVLC
jgi:hypothetical protein